jgi:queuine tRNA-ribosyltransferase/7-cyano-7-deazaguanine tRNA-ribosyltransferase
MVRCLEPEDIKKTDTQVVISNTYHLWRSFEHEGLNEFPGLHEFMGWSGPIMTDSGGFQVFSMGAARELNSGKIKDKNHRSSSGPSRVRVTDSGVYFTEENEEIYFDAELSIRIQEQLGADIILAFDEPNSPLHDYEYSRKAMERTHAWAARSLEAKTSDQLIYGIVQGGHFKDLREESAKCVNSLPFDGFAIGGAFGSSFGSEKNNTFEELEWVNRFLREDKPRHLLGIGRVDDIFEAVEKGIDTMDCVIPTREARHGSIWSREGRFDILKGRYQDDDSPLIQNCFCPVCREYGVKKNELYKLFKEKNSEAPRFATIHNIYFFNDLMAQIREAIGKNKFSDFKKSYLNL